MVVAGFGITYLSGLPLTLEERIAFGTVVGALASTLAGFLLSLAVGLSVLTVLAGLGLALAVGAFGAWRSVPLLAADWGGARARWRSPLGAAGHPWPLLVLLAVCWAWTIHFLAQAYVYKPAGLYAGYVNIWGDWAAHLTYAGSFAYGRNLPPEFPVDPGNHLGYPFMVDFLAAELVSLGSRLTSALPLSSGLLALVFPAVFYLAGVRFLAGRAAAFVGVFVFLLAGGLGFTFLAGDLDRVGLAALQHLPREYTLDRDHNYQWLNPVLAYLVPQRSTLFGFSLVLITTVLLWLALAQPGWRPFWFAGVLAGLTPLFHVHAYGTAVALAAFWAAMHPRRHWVAYFGPALVLGLPALFWMWPPAAGSVRWLAFWLADSEGHHDSPVWFWLKNLSLFVPLLLVAQLWPRLLATGFAAHFAPLWLWFLVPNFLVFQPWDWDNTKFFVFWALFGSLLVGALLARLWQRGLEGATLAALAMVLLGLSGTLDLVRASDFSVNAVLFTDSKGLQAADWVRQNTDARAVFVVAPEHNSPVPTLGGRRVVAGYPGWLWTYGLTDFYDKETDVQRMLHGEADTPDLVRKYHVSYVMIGIQEVSPPVSADVEYWSRNADVVYSNGEYTVYRVRSG
ncbi:MAG TPA: hypothetical protein VK131_02850 [Candidatus Acidoferrales bacterium]|nr:hypothetical protein [Candidatus Acidoferrales bacterium]